MIQGKNYKNSRNAGRKAVSPLVASVLLIAFTMAIAAVLTAWLSTFTATTKEQAAVSERQIACGKARLDIDRGYIFYNSTDEILKAEIRNSGDYDVKLTNYQTWYRESPITYVWTLADKNLTIKLHDFIIRTFNVSGDGLTLKRIKFTTDCEGVFDSVDQETSFPGGWPAIPLNVADTLAASRQ